MFARDPFTHTNLALDDKRLQNSVKEFRLKNNEHGSKSQSTTKEEAQTIKVNK